MSFFHRHCNGRHDYVSQARDCERAKPAVPKEEQQRFAKGGGRGKEPPQPRKPSPEMLRHIRYLLRHRNIPQAYATEVQRYLDEGMFSAGGAYRTIDKLKEFPERAEFNQPDQHPTTQADLKEGVYRNPDTGELWAARHRINEPNSPLYACIIIIRQQPVLGPNKEIIEPAKIGFEYVRGGIRTLHPSWRLTVEQAKEFGNLYGVCLKCGSELSKEDSIERGMGPVCAGKQWD